MHPQGCTRRFFRYRHELYRVFLPVIVEQSYPQVLLIIIVTDKAKMYTVVQR